MPLAALSKCPFCGLSDLRVASSGCEPDMESGGGFAIECPKCGLRGPRADSLGSAYRMWDWLGRRLRGAAPGGQLARMDREANWLAQRLGPAEHRMCSLCCFKDADCASHANQSGWQLTCIDCWRHEARLAVDEQEGEWMPWEQTLRRTIERYERMLLKAYEDLRELDPSFTPRLAPMAEGCLKAGD